jgi:hypothetical protein
MMDNHLWGHKPFSYGQAWVHMLMLANHKDGVIWVSQTPVKVARGQLGWSQERLASEFGWTRQQVRTFLNHLKRDHMINQEQHGKMSIITILNYEKYHGDNQIDNHPVTSRQPAGNQPVTTNKNDKNVKNEKKESIVAGDKITFDRSTRKFDGITPDYLTYLKGQYPAINVEDKLRDMETWLDANPKNQKSNYKRFITNWLKREQDKAPRVQEQEPGSSSVWDKYRGDK